MEHGHLDVLRRLLAWSAAGQYAADEDKPAILFAGGDVYVECWDDLHACHDKVSFVYAVYVLSLTL